MNEESLAYDLRQKYAEIVGVHLEAVSNARMVCDYPAYFKSLENLYVVIRHKFKSKKEVEGEGKKKIKVTDAERYEKLRAEAIRLANEYENAYLGKTEDPDHIAKIENAFREIEMFLFKVMDSSKMFGSSGYNEGL